MGALSEGCIYDLRNLLVERLACHFDKAQAAFNLFQGHATCMRCMCVCGYKCGVQNVFAIRTLCVPVSSQDGLEG